VVTAATKVFVLGHLGRLRVRGRQLCSCARRRRHHAPDKVAAFRHEALAHWKSANALKRRADRDAVPLDLGCDGSGDDPLEKIFQSDPREDWSLVTGSHSYADRFASSGSRSSSIELNALLCELAARAAAACDRTGPLLHAAPFTVHGPRTGRVDPDHDARPLDADPTNELPPGHLVHNGISHPGLLEPDATLVGRHRDTGQPIAVLIEYDRTRRATKLTGKLARYDHFLTEGWRRTRYARHPDEPAVLFITRTDTHLPNALSEADRQLTAHARPDNDATRACYPGREELAFTSRGRLLDGDDTILQTTPQANPEARPAHTRTPTLQARLSLSTLFS
jgi:hypothetical protein